MLDQKLWINMNQFGCYWKRSIFRVPLRTKTKREIGNFYIVYDLGENWKKNDNISKFDRLLFDRCFMCAKLIISNIILLFNFKNNKIHNHRFQKYE